MVEQKRKKAAGEFPAGVKLRHTLKGYRALVNRVAWSPDSRTVVSAHAEEVPSVSNLPAALGKIPIEWSLASTLAIVGGLRIAATNARAHSNA